MNKRSITRIMHDIKMYNDNIEDYSGIFLDINENNIFKIKAIIIGPSETPYEGAFLYFDILFGEDYPLKPPVVNFLNAKGEKGIRMHPNLYGEGKVCLSILGTWPGEPWSPTMNLMTILVSIQSLLCSDPLTCEPGREKADRNELDVYNQAVEYWCWNLGILGVLENDFRMPAELHKKIRKYFDKNADQYLKRLEAKEKDTRILRHMYGSVIVCYGPLVPRLNCLVGK